MSNRNITFIHPFWFLSLNKFHNLFALYNTLSAYFSRILCPKYIRVRCCDYNKSRKQISREHISSLIKTKSHLCIHFVMYSIVFKVKLDIICSSPYATKIHIYSWITIWLYHNILHMLHSLHIYYVLSNKNYQHRKSNSQKLINANENYRIVHRRRLNKENISWLQVT